MKPALRMMLCDDAGERFFGEGPCRLLHLIEETGSLRSAAAQMGLSYSKALRLVQHAEKELGFALTCKTIGGRGGGGSYSWFSEAAKGSATGASRGAGFLR
jgi:molybdate transport system regulatory protein